MSNQPKSPQEPGYDSRFDFPFPNNADGFHNPGQGNQNTDRFPNRAVVLPVPPPRNNAGADGMGAPPRRDRRLPRAMGQNICAVINPDFSEARPTISAQLASLDFGADEDHPDSETFLASFKAYDFAENAVTGLGGGAVIDPFSGVDSHVIGLGGANGSGSVGIFQSLEVIANLQWGTDGVNQKVLVNMPAGQIIRGNMSGTYCRGNALLTAHYYERFQGPNIGAHENFFYLDPDPNKRNNLFNSINSPILVPSIGFDPGTVPSTPIHLEAIIGLGTPATGQGGSFDRSSRMTRRFYGTFPSVNAYPGGGALVFCPVAFGASAVMLSACPTSFTTFAGNILAPLFMGMLDHAGNVIGQLPSNTFFPLAANCAQIFVYNPGNPNAAENPFALIFDLGL